MSTWNAIYLRGEVPADFHVELEGEIPLRRVGDWTELALPGVQTGEPMALALSSRVPGDLVWIQIQTTASVLGLLHCENGQIVRRLEFSDGLWRRVEGTPRPWEDWLFSAEQLEEALEIHDDEAEVRAAFAEKTLAAGNSLPWPPEYDSMWKALGVTEAEWMQARALQPSRVLIGHKPSRLTIGSRALLVAGLSSIAAGIAMRGDLRAGLIALGVPLLLLGLGAAWLRRATMGRWLF